MSEKLTYHGLWPMKNGRGFLGKFTLDGKNYVMMLYPKTNKTNDRQPDYDFTIVEDQPQAVQQEAYDDGIPF